MMKRLQFSGFVEAKVSTWVRELQLLSDISITHPHAAYAGFIHGFIGKWNFLMRCIPNIENFLAPVSNSWEVWLYARLYCM